MEGDLISKKELLERTGISYGQLYRWKRKNLIPEEWFIRKSTFTGQETFFPRDRILQRIGKIMNMKEDLSLDELADVFSPEPAAMLLNGAELVRRRIVSKEALALYEEASAGGSGEPLPFEQQLFVYLLDGFLERGEMVLEEGRQLIRLLQAHYPKLGSQGAEVILIRKLGVSAVTLSAGLDAIWFEEGVRIVARRSVASAGEELKLKLGAGGTSE